MECSKCSFSKSVFCQNISDKFSKETLAVTFLFQCNFVLVVGADNLVWQVYFFIGFFWHGVGSILR